MTPDSFEIWHGIGIGLGTAATVAAGWLKVMGDRRKGAITTDSGRLSEHVMTIADHDAVCSERWEHRSKLCGLELKAAMRDAFKEAAADLYQDVREIKEEQREQRSRVDRLADRIKASYAGAAIAGASVAAAIKPG